MEIELAGGFDRLEEILHDLAVGFFVSLPHVFGQVPGETRDAQVHEQVGNEGDKEHGKEITVTVEVREMGDLLQKILVSDDVSEGGIF
jgi:PDZ domain-containing secreted protein